MSAKRIAFVWNQLRTRGWISLMGIARYTFRHPIAGTGLFTRRLWYVLTKKLYSTWVSPDGYAIETGEALVSYWGMFIEKDLQLDVWTDWVRQAAAPVIVDVGANYGVFTHLAHTLNANAQVLSVEPQPDLWHRICEYNREHGFVGSFAVQTACGDHHHEATLLMRYPGDMSATLVPEHAERGSLQVLLVPVVPLDQLVADLGTIDVLKIDAEGHDYQVLCGLSDIAKRVRFVIVEKRPLTPGAWCSVTSLLGPRFVQIPLTANDCLYVNKDLVPSEPVKCAMKTI